MGAETPSFEDEALARVYVEQVLRHLPRHERAVMLLAMDGLSEKEMCNTLGLPLRTLQRYLASAKVNARRRMSDAV